MVFALSDQLTVPTSHATALTAVGETSGRSVVAGTDGAVLKDEHSAYLASEAIGPSTNRLRDLHVIPVFLDLAFPPGHRREVYMAIPPLLTSDPSTPRALFACVNGAGFWL